MAIEQKGYEAAADAVESKLLELQQNNTPVGGMMAVLKGYMMDEKSFKPAERNKLLRSVNQALGVNWSMKQVTRAGKQPVDTLFTREWPDLIQSVDGELAGTVQVSLPVSPAAAVLPAATTTTTTVGETDMTATTATATAVNETVVTETTAAPVAPVAAPAPEVFDPLGLQEPAEPVIVDKAADKAAFLKSLTDAGVTTEQLQVALFGKYFAAHPNDLLQLAYSKKLGSQSPAEAFYEIVICADATSVVNFVKLLTNLGQPAATTKTTSTTTTREWYSFTGEKDGSIRGGWVGAISAAVSAGLAIAHNGELTIGSGVGAALGVVGAFVAGEFIGNRIDSQFGSYVAVGSVGLALGAGGVIGGSTLANMMGHGNTPIIGGTPAPVVG